MNRPMRNIVRRNTIRRKTLRPAGCFLGCLLVLASVLMAQGPSRTLEIPTTIDSFTGETPVTQIIAQDIGLSVEAGRVPLALDQAIAMALRRNLTLVVQRYVRSQSILGIDQNLGIYDYNLTATGGLQENTQPRSSALQATGGQDLVTEGQAINVRVTRLTPMGGTAQVDFNNARGASSDLTQFINPSFTIDLDLTFTQPVLRNFGRYVTERNLIVARTDAAISRADFQNQVETIIQQTSDGYWSLVESLEQLKVAEESLALAEELHEMNRIQVEVGTKAPLEMVQSEAGVAARRQDIIRFRAQVADAADELRRLANLDRGELWETELTPTTNPEVAHRPIDLEAAVTTALEMRPDVRRRQLQNDTLELDARVARNQKRPQLNLQAVYRYNALDGDLRDPQTGEVVAAGGYGDALQQIVDRDFDGWTLGFSFAYPLQNRDAKARSAIADLALEQGEYQLRDLELQVLAEVRSAARAVETAAEQIESAKVSSKLAQKNLDAERKRYENGLSTSFQVLQIQEDLSEARRLEVSAIISYRRAETAFYRAIGKLLEQHDVVLADDEEP